MNAFVTTSLAAPPRENALVTSDPVIGETATRLRYDAGLGPALVFHQIPDEAVSSGALRIRDSDAKLRKAGFDLMSRYAALSLSYADAVGAVATREIGAAVFGLARDFQALGFVLEPG